MFWHSPVILRPRAGFTLVELLVVISIIVLVMGSAIAGLSGFGSGTNRLLAAEQLTADLVRQARHTAATTGVPAVIRITQISDELDGISRVSGGEISGLDSTVLHEQRFEDDTTWQDPDKKETTTGNKSGQTIPIQGRTGHGLAITLNGSTLQWPTDKKTLKKTFAESPSERLIRSTAAKPGFLLSASVWVPAITSSSTPYHLPVALIGTDDAPTIATSLAGLMLRKHIRPLHLKTKIDGDANSTATAATMSTWEILGWIGDGKDALAWVSSCDDTARITPPPSDLQTTAIWDYSIFTDISPGTVSNSNSNSNGTVTDFLTNRPLWNTQSRDLAAPLAGGRWVELGLHYDGATLRLFCDGAVVGILAAATTPFPTLPADDTHDTIWYGVATLPNTIAGPYASRTGLPSDKTCYADGAVLDDVRLLRLGTGLAMSLPNGLRPWINGSTDAWYQITAQPDGRVAIAVMQPSTTSSGGTSSTTITATATTTIGFAEAADPNFIASPSGQPSRWSLITVTASGSVSASIHLVDGNGKTDL